MKLFKTFLIWILFITTPFFLGAKEIALSFDDGPWYYDGEIYSAMERSNLFMSKFKKLGVEEVIFFVNGKKANTTIGQKQVSLYAKNGHLLGNHTFRHLNPNRDGLTKYLADVRKGHEVIKDLPGFVNLFRYPQLKEGNSVKVRDRIRKELSSLGYSNGYVTVDNYDFYMNTIVQRALAKGKKVDYERLRPVYLGVLLRAVEYYNKIAIETLGRSPKHMLLLHENDLAAMFIDDLVKALRAKGWKIIKASEAYTDPISKQIPDTLYNGQGRVAALAHVKLNKKFKNKEENTKYLEDLFKKEGVFSASN